MTKKNDGHREREHMTEEVDAGPVEDASSLAGDKDKDNDDDAVDESARKTRELSTLLSLAWSGRT
jgi:hypothetical protein